MPDNLGPTATAGRVGRGDLYSAPAAIGQRPPRVDVGTDSIAVVDEI
jgi:hypothetical protein